MSETSPRSAYLAGSSRDLAGIRAVIFDLDGTLVDSAPGIAAVLNEMRFERGLAARSVAWYRRGISRGARALVSAALETGSDSLDEFRARYGEQTTNPEAIWPGVSEALQALSRAGLPLAVCSNKPEMLCRKVLSDVSLLDAFALVVGGDTLATQKPHPAPLHHVVSELGLVPRATCFVGDSTVDEQAALAAGIPFIFFAAGYDDGVAVQRHACIDSMLDLLPLLRSTAVDAA